MNSEIERLSARKNELEFRLHSIRCDFRRGLDRDSEEQALQLENMEVLQEISRVTERELDKVNRRLSELRSRH
jgi:hypothetical protein